MSKPTGILISLLNLTFGIYRVISEQIMFLWEDQLNKVDIVGGEKWTKSNIH
jgi:hypothetical protein